MKIKKQLISTVLVVVLCVSVFAMAAPAASAYTYATGDYYGYVNALADKLSGYGISYEKVRAFCDSVSFPSLMSVSVDDIKAMSSQYNYSFFSFLSQNGIKDAFNDFYQDYFGAAVTYIPGQSIYRLIDNATNVFITDKNGNYPYAVALGDAPETISEPGDIFADRWLKYTEVDTRKLVRVTEQTLSNIIISLNESTTLNPSLVEWGSDFTCIASSYVDGSGEARFLCNSEGFLYVANASNSVTDMPMDYYPTTNNNNTTNTQIIDNSNNQIVIINENGDKTIMNIDSLIWNDDNRSYTANVYDYNIVNNSYTYYTYNITYHISNTYITYIGANDSYEREEYQYYYELPDGRSSEELTADEIAGMSFEFSDMTNYARGSTDTSLRVLYHFDGNTEDSGYFSTQSDGFTWNSGASITYMDSGAFGGALYLDETAHHFTINLPSALAPTGKDFSIQWRHYQASQADTLTNRENYISIGGTQIMTWDERSIYWNGATSATTTMPIGSWHEMALVRHNGTLRLYLNGVAIASLAHTAALTNQIMFFFGNSSRQYTMLDELRVLNFAVVEGGAAYTPTTVPYDTNLVLVLPDGEFPIAAEYWDFNNPNAISQFDMTLGYAPSGIINYGIPANTYVSYNDGYVSMGRTSGSGKPFISFKGLGAKNTRNYYTLIDTNGNIYTASVVVGYYDDEGRYFFSGTPTGTLTNLFNLSIISSADTKLELKDPAVPFDFIYFEISSSPITPSQFEHVTALYSSADIKPNTAAVQSSIPVTGYQVGGVRPTFPQRGTVWMPVERSRISGVYIYSGQMWEQVGSRYYTGSRWIPIYAFDVYTLEDYWDINDIDTVVVPITSDVAGWNWFKATWITFTQWLSNAVDRIVGAIEGGGATPAPGESPGQDVDIDINFTFDGDDGNTESLLSIGKKGIDGVWELIKGLFGSVFNGLFSQLGDGIGGMTRIFSGSGEAVEFYYGGGIWD